MKSFEVLYTKDPAHKKRKVYHDGILRVETNERGSTAFKVILLSEDNKVLFQQGSTGKDVSKYRSDSEVKVGSYQVQIEKENTLPGTEQEKTASLFPEDRQAIQTQSVTGRVSKASLLLKRRAPFKPQSLFTKTTSSSASDRPSASSSSSSSGGPMKQFSNQYTPSQQVVAVEFLLNRLCPSSASVSPGLIPWAVPSTKPTPMVDHELDYILDTEEDMHGSTEKDEDEGDFDKEDEDESFLDHSTVARLAKRRKCYPLTSLTALQHPGSKFKDCRGAVLADEMGLGKSLVSIAVLWHFVKHGKAKGVIVCPSSLVDNWHKELKKWLGVRLNAIRVRAGAQASADVQTFVVGHRSMSPVLIISYELFRKHASTINKVPKLEVIICDEGHRLKNVTGTQTTRALTSCVAKNRIVLTGSPIQNNLDELYAILQFVAPDNELGSLHQFKARLTRLQESQESSSTSALPTCIRDPQVSRVLGSLMLRRTQDEVLRHLLPPRTEVMLHVSLSATQESQYQTESRRILDTLHSNGGSGSDTILPGLQRLRQICNVALTDETFRAPMSDLQRQQQNLEDEESGGFDYGLQGSAERATAWTAGSDGGSGGAVAKLAVDDVLRSSSKLQLLDSMLQAIHQERTAASSSSAPSLAGGKVVIVSNFTSMLDHISQLLAKRGWSGLLKQKQQHQQHQQKQEVLRLDGSVSCELRQGLVERFNRASDPSWVFLLAAKAGGVGLNLIGANRLIMMDCDWNPSIDLQAMARVWRQGQRLPVTVFRFVSEGKIEQSIMKRQRKKGALCSVLQCLNPPSTSRVSDRTGICKEDDDEEEDTSATWDQLLRSDEGDGREPGGGDGGGGGGGGGVTQGGEMSQLEQLIAPPSSYCSSSSSTSSSSSMLPAPSGERDAATAPGRGGGTGSATTFRDPVLTHVCGLTQQEHFLGMTEVS